MNRTDIVAPAPAGETRTLAACMAKAGTAAGTVEVANYLRSQPFPHYEADPLEPGVFLRIDEDGTRIRGRFLKREFIISQSRENPENQ
jgi:hypothetical protein